MNKFLILLKSGKHQAINRFLQSSKSQKKWIGQLVGFGTIILFLYIAVNTAFEYGTEKFGDNFTPLLIQFISVFMTIGIAMTIRDSMEKAMANFYEDEDISLLVSSPVSVYSVVSYKYVQLNFETLFSMIVWLVTPWIAIGRTFDAPWQFYIIMTTTLTILLMVINASVILVFMIINRYLSSRRFMQIVKIAGIIIASFVGVGIALFGILGLDNEVGFVEFLSKIKAPKSAWYPHVWTINILTSFLHLPQLKFEPLGWTARLVGLFATVLGILILVSGKIYYRSWELFRVVEQARINTRKKRIIKSHKIKKRGIKTAIIIKDIRNLVKDIRQILMIVMLSVILVLTIFGFRIKDTEEHFPIAIQIAIYTTIISSSLSWQAFKKEGDSWWILQSSPISPKKLYNAKLILSCSVAFLYSEFWIVIAILTFKTSLQISLQMMLLGLAPAVIASVNTSIGSFPWIAEIGASKDKDNQVAKILTKILAIIFPILILTVSIILLNLSWGQKILRESLAVSILILFYIVVFSISYFIGIRNSVKLVFS